MDLGRLLNPPTLVEPVTSDSSSIATQRFAQTAKSAQYLRRLRARLGLASLRVTCQKDDALAALERALQLDLSDRTRTPIAKDATANRRGRSHTMPSSLSMRGISLKGTHDLVDYSPQRASSSTPSTSTVSSTNNDTTSTSTITSDAEAGAELLLFVKYAHTQPLQSLDEALNVSNINSRINNRVTSHVLSSPVHVSSKVSMPLPSSTSCHSLSNQHPHPHPPSRRHTMAKRVAAHPYRAIAPLPALSSLVPNVTKQPTTTAAATSSSSPPLNAQSMMMMMPPPPPMPRQRTSTELPLQSPWPTPDSSPNFSALSCSASNLREMPSDMPSFTKLPQSLLPAGQYMA
ncbi:hypothetical protein BDF22DRAFT_653421 [Syncephalis plumigaleata]|nr:hypothetical protein BDF22DRAFT_653421 [Syncephalis plumigaleata]